MIKQRKSAEEILSIAIKTLKEEAQAVERLCDYLDDDFARVVDLILQSEGRLIVTGIGKSANIATKIVSTLNSTGTPSVFMHAADAVHGDLGNITDNDVVICISNSGNTPEIKVLVSFLKMRPNPLIALVGKRDSFLAEQADYILDASVEREACPNNLAPTSSTTAQLAMGDAVAVALLECRGFTREDFAKFHPGGALGKQLYLRVKDLFVKNAVPVVKETDGVRNVIMEISGKRLGATAVTDDNGRLTGIITDGDLRRMLESEGDVTKVKAKAIMSVNPQTIASETMLTEALDLMRLKNITQLLVVDNDVYVGVLHLHDILREGII